MPSIKTHGLTKRFGNDIVAVNNLDLTVESGEVFGFLGPNGAGKSTTIDMLLGLTQPTAGEATVLGHDVRTELTEIRQRIGVLPEGLGLYDQLSGYEHVETAMRMKDVDEDPAEKLEYVGLDEAAWHRPTAGYSKGMGRRLGLAIALVGDPELLILDEPGSGLDPTGIQDVRTIAQEQTEADRTVFFSSHLLAEIEAVCDTVGIMNEGQLVTVQDIEGLRATGSAAPRVELKVVSVPAGLDDELEALSGITEVSVEDSTVSVICAEPAAKMTAIRAVDDAARIRDVVAEEGSLESLFNQYTAGTDKRSA